MKKVLVCDDDEGISEVIKIILEDGGYKVKILNNGRAIQKRIEEFCPNLLLLDLWLPGINGQEIVKVLKKDDKCKDLPVIIISALTDLEKISKKSGATDYLEKPFNINRLKEIVGKYT